MSVASFLLRVLLSVLLMFNGAAGAAAGVHMAGGGHTALATASMPAMQQSDMAGCHDKADATMQKQQLASKAGSAGHSDADDCCKDSDACRCDCLHHTSALMPDLEWRPVALSPPSGESLPTHGIATAPQRLLLRPPIA